MTGGTRDHDVSEDVLRHASEPGEWSEEAEPIQVKPSKTEVVSFRLPTEEFDQLTEAASTAGESLSTFIRGALAIRMHGTPFGPTIEIYSGLPGEGRLQVRSYLAAAHNESLAPEFPLRTASLG